MRGRLRPRAERGERIGRIDVAQHRAVGFHVADQLVMGRDQFPGAQVAAERLDLRKETPRPQDRDCHACCSWTAMQMERPSAGENAAIMRSMSEAEISGMSPSSTIAPSQLAGTAWMPAFKDALKPAA